MIGMEEAKALGKIVTDLIDGAGLERKPGYESCCNIVKMQQLHEQTKLRFMDAGKSEAEASSLATAAITEYYDKLNNEWKGIPNNMAVRVYNRKARELDLPIFEEKPRTPAEDGRGEGEGDGDGERRPGEGDGERKPGEGDGEPKPSDGEGEPKPSDGEGEGDDSPEEPDRIPLAEASGEGGEGGDGSPSRDMSKYPYLQFGKGPAIAIKQDALMDGLMISLLSATVDAQKVKDIPKFRVNEAAIQKDGVPVTSKIDEIADFIRKWEPPVPDGILFGDSEHGFCTLTGTDVGKLIDETWRYIEDREDFADVIDRMSPEFIMSIPHKEVVICEARGEIGVIPHGYVSLGELAKKYLPPEAEDAGDELPEATGDSSIPRGRRVILRKDGNKYLAPAEFDQLLILLAQKFNVILEGVPGCGKTEMAIAIAEVLGIPVFIVTSPQDRYDVIGYNDANGNYVPTDFVKAYGQECILILDELDRATNDARICINSALANGILATPKGNIEKHPGCRIVACTNTNGRGPTANHASAIAFDASTLDRFVTLRVDYDRAIEEFITGGDKELVDFLDEYRETCKKLGLDAPLVSYRGMANLAKLKKTEELKESDEVKSMEAKLKEVTVNGSPKLSFKYFTAANILRSAIGKEQVSGDDLKTIAKSMKNQESPYVKALASLGRTMAKEGILE